VTAAFVGFIGVVVGLAVGFGYRFWATRRDELAQATVAVTFMRDELRQLRHAESPSLHGAWVRMSRDQRTALIVQLTPEDYLHLSSAIEAFEADPNGPSGERVVTALDGLVRLFWSEYQAFILSPLVKYLRRDDLTKKLGDILDAALGESINPPTRGQGKEP
jgi:hypothetical protein